MTTGNDALNDEYQALNSIYGDDTLIVSNDISAVLKLPDLPFSFLVSFPALYPDTPPQINGTQSTGNSGKGEGEAAVTILREVLTRIWTPGQVCLFDLMEEAGPLLHQHHNNSNGPPQDAVEEAALPHNRSAPAPSGSTESPPLIDAPDLTAALSFDPPAQSLPAPPIWTLSEPLTVNKSTFVARATPISSLHDATDAISHLLSTNKKVAAATHNISAWRIQSPATVPGQATPKVIQDCDDDGESAAGGRLLHLMQLMEVWNVVVVVSRWYGGVKLGSDRFRLINSVAREALVKGGFARDKEREKGSSSKRGKK